MEKLVKINTSRSQLARITIGQLAILGIFLMLFWAVGIPYLQNLGVTPGPTRTTVVGGVDVTKPLKIAVMDAYAGSGVSSATIEIYKGTTRVETLSSGSDGTVTTALTYRSGDVLDIRLQKSTAKYWAKLTVPKMTPADAQSLSFNPVTVNLYTLGTYTITVVRSTGASLTSGSNFNFTTAGVVQESFTVSVFNTADNTGFLTSQDPINQRKLGAFLEVAVTGSAYDKFLVTGLQGFRSTGSGNFYTRTVSDNEISRVKVGSTVTQSGSFSVVIQVDSSPASSGNTAVLTIRLNLMGDEQRFINMGDKGTDNVVAATFTLNLQK